MKEPRVSFEMLNAYVDGELDAETAADVAAAVAGDPVLAREVSALSRLRSTVANSIDVPPLAIPAGPALSARGTCFAISWPEDLNMFEIVNATWLAPAVDPATSRTAITPRTTRPANVSRSLMCFAP